MVINRKKTYQLDLEQFSGKNYIGISFSMGGEKGLEVLSICSNGTFKIPEDKFGFVSGKNLNWGICGGDKITIKDVRYSGNGKTVVLSFKEYDKLGRRKKISLVEQATIKGL
ncbi:MAG: hypothetical protein HQ538_01815 [Parcubacteria group bacterium]|nr:hypothetical protein [Parcubacteria group bacterium]